MEELGKRNWKWTDAGCFLLDRIWGAGHQTHISPCKLSLFEMKSRQWKTIPGNLLFVRMLIWWKSWKALKWLLNQLTASFASIGLKMVLKPTFCIFNDWYFLEEIPVYFWKNCPDSLVGGFCSWKERGKWKEGHLFPSKEEVIFQTVSCW